MRDCNSVSHEDIDWRYRVLKRLTERPAGEVDLRQASKDEVAHFLGHINSGRPCASRRCSHPFAHGRGSSAFA